MSQRLSGLFSQAAVKRLSAVEASPAHSNQHEFNGTAPLRHVFGTERSQRPTRFMYLGDDEDETVTADGFLTWYDAREAHPTRSEYRLYFPRTAVSGSLHPGDTAFLLLRPDGRVLVAFARAHSTAEQQLLWLFHMPAPDAGVELWTPSDAAEPWGFAARQILDTLGIETEPAPVAQESAHDVLIARYGDGFPPTAEFSAFARSLTDHVSPTEDPDGALVTWMEREEALFRHLERHLLQQRLEEGFHGDVDAFLSVSLSVQNRRKSRAGRALENHVEALLRARGIPYERGVVTEGASRPDFLFPSAVSYRSPDFPADRLRMLAVKSTCKDRWRQILAEADRITRKHLLTIEPSISDAQTREMWSRSVALVVPRELHSTYTSDQRTGLLTVEMLLEQLGA